MNISGTSVDNTHNGDTLILGDLTVQGNIFDEGGSLGIPDVEREDHQGLIAYAGTNPATGGVNFITDRKYILKKHGNWRIMTGKVDLTLIINGYNYFSIAFDIPNGDTIPTTTSIYLNGGVSSDPFGNSPNFVAQSVSVPANKIIIGYVTADKTNWPQSQSVPTTARYCISYLTLQSDPNLEVLEQVPSYVVNPMVEQLDANNYNIINVGNIQASTFNGGSILTNPLNTSLNVNSNNILNVNSIEATTLGATTTNTTNIFVDTVGAITQQNLSFSSGIDMKTNPVINVSELKVSTLSSNSGFITASSGIDMNNNQIQNLTDIKTTGQKLRIIGGPLQLENDNSITDIRISNNIDLSGRDVKDVDNVFTHRILGTAGNPLIIDSAVGYTIDLKDDTNIEGSLNVSNILKTDTINPNTTVNITIQAATGFAKMIGSSKAIVESGDDVELICDLGANVRLTNNLDLDGSTIYLKSTTGIIDFDNGNLNNVDFITNPDQPIVITGSKIEMRSNPPGIGKVEFYTDIDMKDNNIDNVGIISSTSAMEFKSPDAYIFDNYVDFITKRFNGIKYVKAEPDFENFNTLFGVYVIVGNIIMTTPLNITGSCLIAGYNNVSTLTFNITDGNEITYCLKNTDNSGNIELKDFIFTNQCTSTRAGSSFNNSSINTNILRVSNVNYYNCKNNYPLRISGFELVELINCTFRYNYGGTSGPMCNIDGTRNAIIESCEFYNNYQLGNPSLIYTSPLLSISGTSNNLTITGNQFATYGAGSLGGIDISDSGTTNRVIIDGNVFDAEAGSDPSKLLQVDTSIHKGLICNENTGILSCKASLEGLVNGNTVYTETVLNTWVPVDLTGFVTGDISRFIPGLSPYSFVYDATNPIKTLISVNCAADHSTGGTDTVRLGISVNGTVSVFVQADLNSGQTQSVNISTVLSLNYTDTVQLVCQNVTAGSNTNGFRAVSLNASLIEI